MKNKINDIKKAMSNGSYQSALALTLSLPDICRQVEYGNTKSGTDGYPAWIDTYVDFSECYIGFGTEEAELNGKICYALRCSFLHCGNDDILSQKVAKNCTIDNFELRKPNGIEGGYGYAYRIKNHQNGDKEISTIFDVEFFCTLICDAVEKYYDNHPNKNEFDKYICAKFID